MIVTFDDIRWLENYAGQFKYHGKEIPEGLDEEFITRFLIYRSRGKSFEVSLIGAIQDLSADIRPPDVRHKDAHR